MVKRKAKALPEGEALASSKKSRPNGNACKHVTEAPPTALRLEDLSSYDDFCTDLLVDKVNPFEISHWLCKLMLVRYFSGRQRVKIKLLLLPAVVSLSERSQTF